MNLEKNNINLLNDAYIQKLSAFEKTNKEMSRFKSKVNNYLASSRSVMPNPEVITSPLVETIMNTPNVAPNAASSNVVLLQNEGVQTGVARFNLTIYRKTANIASVLPVPVFGALDYESDYVEVLAPYLPAGCTYVIERTSDKKGLKITYTVGMASDIVEVNVKEKPYLSLLRGTQTSTIKLSQMKAKIFDVADEQQFSETIRPVINTLFGLATSNPFTADDWLRDDQFVQTMRTINQDVNVDAETTVVFGMTNIANNVMTITTTVGRYQTIR